MLSGSEIKSTTEKGDVRNELPFLTAPFFSRIRSGSQSVFTEHFHRALSKFPSKDNLTRSVQRKMKNLAKFRDSGILDKICHAVFGLEKGLAHYFCAYL